MLELFIILTSSSSASYPLGSQLTQLQVITLVALQQMLNYKSCLKYFLISLCIKFIIINNFNKKKKKKTHNKIV